MARPATSMPHECVDLAFHFSRQSTKTTGTAQASWNVVPWPCPKWHEVPQLLSSGPPQKNISSSRNSAKTWWFLGKKKGLTANNQQEKLDQIKGFDYLPANLGQMMVALYSIFCNPFTAKWHHPNGILPNVSLDAFQCRSFSRGLTTVVGTGPLSFEMQKNRSFWSFINLHQIFKKLC